MTGVKFQPIVKCEIREKKKGRFFFMPSQNDKYRTLAYNISMQYVLCAVAGGAGNKDFFTYGVPKELESKLEVGQIVSLPFRGKKSAGIVIESAKKPNFDTKEITGIIEGPLPEYLVK